MDTNLASDTHAQAVPNGSALNVHKTMDASVFRLSSVCWRRQLTEMNNRLFKLELKMLMMKLLLLLLMMNSQQHHLLILRKFKYQHVWKKRADGIRMMNSQHV